MSGARTSYGTVAGANCPSQDPITRQFPPSTRGWCRALGRRRDGALQERAIRPFEVLTKQLQGALNSRVAIEHAKDALAHVRGASPDRVFKLICDYARRHGLRQSDVARAVVSDPCSPPRQRARLPARRSPPPVGDTDGPASHRRLSGGHDLHEERDLTRHAWQEPERVPRVAGC